MARRQAFARRDCAETSRYLDLVHIDRGALILGKLGGVPIGLHWSLPIGYALITDFTFNVWLWLSLGLLILVHEGGHALVARWAGARPKRIVLSGLGGFCEWSGFVSPAAEAAISFGGVWAQAVVLLIALVLDANGVFEVYGPSAYVRYIVIERNQWLMLFNLLPVAPLDGAQAWRLPILLGRSLRARLSRTKPEPAAPFAMPSEPEPEVSEEAKQLAAKLLDDARRGGDT